MSTMYDMSMTFTKLFSSITASTVWCKDPCTKVVWITMLAMADKKGRVWASIPGLAKEAGVSLEDTERALEDFLSPDEYSRTKDYEGRRIKEIDGGWVLLNHAKYRAIRDEAERRAYKTAKQREYRASVDNVDKSGQPCTAVDAGGHNAEAEAYTEADKPEGLNESAWSDYLSHRKELRAKKLTKRGMTMAMNKLAALPAEDQQKVVDTSISNGWIGLFPEKLNEKAQRSGDSFAEKHARVRAAAGLD